MIITVDCGTTNMRCRLFDGKNMLYATNRKAGVRNTAFDGNTDYLASSLKDCINNILEKNSLTPSDIEVIIASGTLASDVGIYKNTSHAICPAGIDDTLKKSVLTTMPDITSIPMFFIPGVKTLPNKDETDPVKKIELADSMSGEECEIYGIIDEMNIKEDFIAVLPGSYLKSMEVTADGKIETIKTGMCGEIIEAVSQQTILKKSIPAPVIRSVDPEKLIFGFEYCKTHGVSPTLIKTRNAMLHLDMSQNDAANFFVGAVLYDDARITAELCKNNKLVVIGGSDPLRSVFAILLDHLGVKNIKTVPDTIASLASNYGAMQVYKKYLESNSVK